MEQTFGKRKSAGPAGGEQPTHRQPTHRQPPAPQPAPPPPVPLAGDWGQMDPAPALPGGGFGTGVEPAPHWPTASPAPDKLSRFAYITGGFAAVCLVVYLLQTIPLVGIVLMFLLAPLWIGLLVHAYFVTLAVLGFTGYLPRPVVALPVMFYASGIAVGIWADIEASRWKATQTWLEVYDRVPDSTRFITFDPWNLMEGSKLRDPKGVFRPDTLGFEMALLKLHKSRGYSRDELLVLQPEIGAGQRCQEPGVRRSRIAERCYLHQSFAPPRSYLQLGGREDLRRSYSDARRAKPPVLDWGSINLTETPVWLVEDGATTRVAVLHGASITKNQYFLWPTAGCVIGGTGNGWGCFTSWRVPFRFEQVGFSLGTLGYSPEAPTLLMQALKALRGQKP